MLPGYRSPWAVAADLLLPEPDPYWDDPYGWVRAHIDFREDEDGPSSDQAEVMGQLPHRKRVSVRGPHGLGKTSLAAWIILWFADTRERAGVDWKVVTTASVWRQLEHYLWPEVRKWARRLHGTRFNPEKQLLMMALKGYFGEAFAVASDQPTNIEGAHAAHILYVLDEAKAIPPDTWDAVEGAFSAGEPYALSISTPGGPQGRFYEIQTHKPGYEDWWTRHVTLAEAMAAGRIRKDWAAARERQWGVTSAVYQNRVLGEFAVQDEDAVVPLSWLEAANLRWQERGDLGATPMSQFGLDVARFGGDKTVFADRRAAHVMPMEVYEGQDTMVTADLAYDRLIANPGAKACVDVIGVGSGVFDRLRQRLGPERVLAFNGSAGTLLRDFSGEFGFVNTRSAGWWTLREVLDPRQGFLIAIPDDDELTGDITAPKWSVKTNARIAVETKEDLIARLGHSPDKGDAVMMSVWPGEPTPSVLVEPEEFTRRSISPV
jgi:hypothetical protein